MLGGSHSEQANSLGAGERWSGGLAVKHWRVSRRKGADRSVPKAVVRAQASAKGSGLEKRVSPAARTSDDQGCDDREMGLC